MDRTEREKKLDRLFARRIRLVAENSKGHFSSTWMFWGHRSDFYFGSKNLLSSLKVSLHENGIWYVSYDKEHFQSKKRLGIMIPSRTVHEWALPVSGTIGAVHVASLFLPSDYCHSEPLSERAKSNTLVLGLEDGSTAEIGVFFSYEEQLALEQKFLQFGKPIVIATLDNKLRVSIVVRSRRFDPSVLPSDEQLRYSKLILLHQPGEIAGTNNLNAMLWNDPSDGEVLHVVDVGGVRLKNSEND